MPKFSVVRLQCYIDALLLVEGCGQMSSYLFSWKYFFAGCERKIFHEKLTMMEDITSTQITEIAQVLCFVLVMLQ